MAAFAARALLLRRSRIFVVRRLLRGKKSHLEAVVAAGECDQRLERTVRSELQTEPAALAHDVATVDGPRLEAERLPGPASAAVVDGANAAERGLLARRVR